MRCILIYDDGEKYEPDYQATEFDSPQLMIEYINDKGIGAKVIAAYEIVKAITIEPFEKVTKYRIAE